MLDASKTRINDLVPSLQLVTAPNADALEHLGNALGLEEDVPEEVVRGRNQRDLSLQIEENFRLLFEQAATTRERARLMSVKLPHV